MLSVCSVYQIANAQSVSELHPLTLQELREYQATSGNTVALQLAMARKLGQFDQKAAIELLMSIPDDQDAGHQLITSALLCEMNVKQGLMDEAAPYCNETIMGSNKPGASGVSFAIARNSLGYYFIRQGKSKLALDQFEQALRTPNLNDKVIQVTILHNRGVGLMLSGLTDMAVEAFAAASADSKMLASDEPLPTILAYNLGYVQAQSGNHEEALRSYAIAMPWLKSTGQLTRQFIATAEISMSLVGTGQFEEALEMLGEWEQRTDFTASADTRAQFSMAKGRALLGLGRRDEAEAELLKGLAIAEEAGNTIRVRELSITYGRMLIENGDAIQAESYLSELVGRLDEQEVIVELAPALELLAQAQALAGNHEAAFLSIRRAGEASRERMSANFARRLASLTVSNELDVKDQQLYVALEKEKVANADQRLSQFIQIVLVLAAGVLLILLTLVLRHRSRLRESELHKEAAQRLSEEVRIRTSEVKQALEQKIAAEKDRADLEVRVANDEKLRLIGQLTGGVAHDFNNLLTVIQLSSELLQEELPEKSKKLAQDIIAASESGKAITEGLLAYARQQVLQPTRVNLTQFFKANRSIFNRAGSNAVELEVEVPPPDSALYILVDTGQLVSAVMNLVLNAKEASDSNGKVKIYCRREDTQVAIVVADEGRGMTAAEVRNAVEPFYSTKAPSEGSGLGLAMVEGFMNQSGGHVQIESTANIGTTIRLVFDLSDSAQTSSSVSTSGLRAVNGETILLVEDDEQIRAVGKMSLEMAGYKVITANNGDEAYHWLSNTSNHLDLLISDLVMPGSLPGDQLIQKAQELRPGLPVLLITGYAAHVPIDYPILLKPFKLNALLSLVRKLIQERHQLNETE